MNGCKFCTGQGWDKVIRLKPCANGDYHADAVIMGDVSPEGVETNMGIVISTYNRGMGFFDIKYCPICGRKLENG